MGGAWDKFTEWKPHGGHQNFDVRYPNLLRNVDRAGVVFAIVCLSLFVASLLNN